MIKRIFIILIILTLTAGTVLAGTSVGGMLGITRSNMTGVENNNTQTNGKWGGSFGFFMVCSLGGNFFLQPALLLTWKGVTKTHTYNTDINNGLGKISSVNATYEMTEEVSLGYIQIPVLVRYEIPVKGKITPRILLGPSFAFNISDKDMASGSGDWDGEHNIGNLKTLDIGGMIGVGVSFPVGKLMCGVDVIYDKSFSSAFKDVTEEELANDVNEELWTKTDPVTFERTTEAVDFRNSGFSFQVSIILPIGWGK